jgi:hypothetical protein
MSWGRLSLFTNVTLEPAGTVSDRGETPLAVIVMVSDGSDGGVGDVGEPLPPLLESPPPHAAAVTSAPRPAQASMRRSTEGRDVIRVIRRTSLKC